MRASAVVVLAATGTLWLACAAAAPAASVVPGADITLYRSDDNPLYSANGDGPAGGGHAVIREERTLALKPGGQDIVIDGLPDHLDAEAVALDFPAGGVSVVSQRLLLAADTGAAVGGLVDRDVTVLGDTGQPLATGTLQRAGNDGLVVRTATGDTLVRRYAAVQANGRIPAGSRLYLHVDAQRAGNAAAVLSYPLTSLGWRAAYVAVLQPGAACRMRLDARASIANRSGRDWHAARLTLIAGTPNFADMPGPRPVMMMAKAMPAAEAALPQQAQMNDYRSYTLPAPVDLPDASVSQVPLYAPRELSCERVALYENGNRYQPPRPLIAPGADPDGSTAVTDRLTLRAFDSLPAGNLRVFARDRDGTPRFIGAGRIDDTPKGGEARIQLGTAFDLRGTRARTAFHVDAAGRTLDEAFRITLSNSGDRPRVVTVRAHPNRWREWTLATSSIRPSRQTTDTIDFAVEVPARGTATLDYAVRYHWTADVQPQ